MRIGTNPNWSAVMSISNSPSEVVILLNQWLIPLT